MVYLSQSIVIRDVGEADRAAVSQLWDTSLAEGHFYMACIGARVIGVGFLEELGENEWWLERPRIDPVFEKKGLRQALYEYGIHRADIICKGTVRFAASLRNDSLHKLAAETGYSATARYVLYQANSLTRSDYDFRAPPDQAAIRAYLNSSPNRLHTRQLVKFTSMWATITDYWLHDLLIHTYAWHGWRDNPQAIDGVIILHPVYGAERPTLRLAYLDAAFGQLAVMAYQIRLFAAAHGYRRVQYWLPTHPSWLVAIEQAGWRRRMNGKDEIALFQHTLGASSTSRTNEVGNYSSSL